MEKKQSWLDSFVESRKAKIDSQKNVKGKNVTASVKKVTVASVDKADIAIIDKSMLPKAVEGNTVRYKNFKWKVVDASYKDNTKKGLGVVMEKIAGIDTKKLTDPAERAMTDPGNVYDYNVRETSEIPDFQQAEAQTSEEIAREDSVDHCTTPEARYQNPVLEGEGASDNVEAPVDAPVAPADSAVEEAPVDESVEAPVEEETVEVSDDVPVVVDEETEEVPVVEDEETPAPAEEVEEDTVEEQSEEEPAEEDTFTFEDVDEKPLDEDDEEETPADSEEDEKKKASVKPKNRILAAMLADK